MDALSRNSRRMSKELKAKFCLILLGLLCLSIRDVRQVLQDFAEAANGIKILQWLFFLSKSSPLSTHRISKRNAISTTLLGSC